MSQSTSHPSGPTNSTSSTKKTLIEEGTELKGTLTSTCPIVVQGRVEGDLSGPSVEVTESGVLSGKAKVTELRSRGEIAGEFDAKVVELSGRVRDKTIIRAESLEVKLRREEGRIEMVFGDCELAIGEAPDKAKAVAAARANGQAKAKAPSPAAALASAASATPATPALAGQAQPAPASAVAAPATSTPVDG